MGTLDGQGFVYVARRDDGLYKIGASREPWVRLRKLRGAGPPLEMVHGIEVSEMAFAERTIQQFFSACRVSGEWFALSHGEISRLQLVTHLSTPESYQRLFGKDHGVSATLRRDTIQLPEVSRIIGISGRTLNEWFKPHRQRKHLTGYPVEVVCEILRAHNVETDADLFRKLPVELATETRRTVIEAEPSANRQDRALVLLQTYQSELRAVTEALQSLQAQVETFKTAMEQERQAAHQREDALLQELRALRTDLTPPKRRWPWLRS